MDIIYTMLAAIVGMVLVITIDIGITKTFDKKSIFQQKILILCQYPAIITNIRSLILQTKRKGGTELSKKLFVFSIVIIGLFLSGCSLQEATEFENNKDIESTIENTKELEIIEAAEDSSTSMPFEVQIDKTSLQIRKEKEVTVIITSNVNDWDFSVSAENGKISNIAENSFTYTAPKDEDDREDTIAIQLTDYENGTLYKYRIPLIFSNNSVIPSMAESNEQ